MKNLLLASLFLASTFFTAYSQITILSTDMPAVGDTLRTATDNNAVGLTIGNAGVNQTWDFSTAVADQLDTNYIIAPSSTPYAANFPTANRAGTQNFTEYLFTRVSGQKYELVGATINVFGTATPVPYSPTDELYRFPTTYNNKFSGNYGFQLFTPFSSLPPNLQADIQAQLPAGVTVTEFRTTNTVTFTDTIDGWGTTITPVCSYNSLRQKRKETSHFVIDARTWFFGFPSWTNVLDSTATTTTYNWLAKETKMPLATAGNLAGSSIGTLTWSLIPPTLSADFSAASQTACTGVGVSFSDRSAGCPTSWLWTFTGATPSSSTDENPTGIVYNTPGTYGVTLQVTRDGVTTTKTLSSYITVNASPTANAGTDATICSGKTATLTASGGTSYAWSSGAATASTVVSPTSSTSYTVTVSNSFGCTASDAVNVSVNPLPLADAGVNDTICPGTIGILTATGGISYAWNNGSNTANLSASPLSTTAYTVTVTDGNGCSASDNASIAVLSLPPADAGVNDTVCYLSVGTLTASGGVSYAWSGGGTTASASYLPSVTTTYTVTVTGANGCSATDSASIIVNPLPVVFLDDDSICSGASATLDAGNAGSTYLWSTTATTRTISVNTAAQYSVTVTNASGCSASDDAQVFVNPLPSASAGPDDTVCYNSPGSLTASGGVSYAWNNGTTTAMLSATPLVSTLYTVTVTDANGCSASDIGKIVVWPAPAADAGINDSICLGDAGTLTASGGLSYAWSTGETTTAITHSPALSTSYTVTVTDNQGCTASDNASIIVNPLPLRQLSDITLCAGSVSTLDAANAGATFLWSTGSTSQMIAVDSAAIYSVVITNTFGCAVTDSATVTISTGLVVNLSDHVICQGTPLTLNAGNPGITHQWSTGANTQTISVTASGTYSVTVIDGVGCSGTDSSVVVVNPLPVADAGANDTICFGQQGTLTASGGVSYTWSSGESTATITKSPASQTAYTVTATDANGCSASDVASIEVNTLPIPVLPDVTLCFGTSVTIDAGNARASYAWSTGSTSQTISVNSTNHYSVTITDANGCSIADTSVVAVRSEIIVALTNQQICQGNTTTLDAGNPGLTHAWSTGASTQSIVVSSAGTYNVTVTDGVGCTAQSSASVVVNAPPVADAGADDTICAGANTVLTASGGVEYLWSTGDTAVSLSVSPATDQSYSVKVTDGNNCFSYDSVSISVNALPVLTVTNDSICEAEVGTLTASGNGSLLWSIGATTNTITDNPTSTTIYSVQLTDNNNCSAVSSAEIFVHAAPAVSAGQDVSVCNGNSVVLTASGGVQYLWNHGQTTASFAIIPLSTIDYVVTVTDANGCSGSDSVHITVLQLPQVSFTGLDSTYCPNAPAATLTGIPTGGTFSGIAVSGNTFSPRLAPAGAFSLTYTYTDANNCTGSHSQQVEVYSESLVNFASLSPAYCVDAPKDTLAITPAGGSLSGNGISGNVFDPAVAGVGGPYAITYARTDSFGCFYSDTAFVTVNGSVPTITGLDTLYCNTGSAVVVSVNPAGGNLSGPGITGNVFDPAQAGNGLHTITYTYTTNGCTNTSTKTVRVRLCTGLEALHELSEISIFPNPASHKLQIDCGALKADELEVAMFDMAGREVYGACCLQKYQVNVQHLAEGVYFIQIQFGRASVMKKVVVARD